MLEDDTEPVIGTDLGCVSLCDHQLRPANVAKVTLISERYAVPISSSWAIDG